jgi:hypothetical protein
MHQTAAFKKRDYYTADHTSVPASVTFHMTKYAFAKHKLPSIKYYPFPYQATYVFSSESRTNGANADFPGCLDVIGSVAQHYNLIRGNANGCNVTCIV